MAGMDWNTTSERPWLHGWPDFSHAYPKARADGYMAGSQCAIKGSYRSNLCTGKWTNNAVQHRGEILAQTSLHPDPGPHNDLQTHYISQQSFAAIQPDAEATSHFVSLEQLLSAAIHKTLKNAYRHADFNIRSNIGNLYFLEADIIKHKDKILGALAIFIEDSARQKIYSDLRVQIVAATGLGILTSALISLLIFIGSATQSLCWKNDFNKRMRKQTYLRPGLCLNKRPKHRRAAKWRI